MEKTRQKLLQKLRHNTKKQESYYSLKRKENEQERLLLIKMNEDIKNDIQRDKLKLEYDQQSYDVFYKMSQKLPIYLQLINKFIEDVSANKDLSYFDKFVSSISMFIENFSIEQRNMLKLRLHILKQGLLESKALNLNRIPPDQIKIKRRTKELNLLDDVINLLNKEYRKIGKQRLIQASSAKQIQPKLTDIGEEKEEDDTRPLIEQPRHVEFETEASSIPQHESDDETAIAVPTDYKRFVLRDQEVYNLSRLSLGKLKNYGN